MDRVDNLVGRVDFQGVLVEEVDLGALVVDQQVLFEDREVVEEDQVM